MPHVYLPTVAESDAAMREYVQATRFDKPYPDGTTVEDGLPVVEADPEDLDGE